MPAATGEGASLAGRHMRCSGRWSRSIILLATIASGLASVGCGPSPTPSPSRACTPGASIACTCSDGRPGSQICNSAGSELGQCTCSGVEAGSTGAAGDSTSGAGGAGGGAAAGSGGGGVAGIAGQAGTTASGGAAGGRDGGTAGSSVAGGDGGGGTGASNSDAGSQPGDAASADGSVTTTMPGGYNGRLATVLIEDALIGPAKADGTPWDPGNPIPPGVFTDLNMALADVNPFDAAFAVLAEPLLTDALTATEKPDCYGTMRLDGLGQVGTEYWLATRDQRTEDSYTPAFPSASGFSSVPIDADVRLRIHLWDADFIGSDDEVGIAVINSADMQTALSAQKKYPVAVWDQTYKQILFISIDVLQE
jgi:hypothetical protein